MCFWDYIFLDYISLECIGRGTWKKLTVPFAQPANQSNIEKSIFEESFTFYIPESYIMYLSDGCWFILCTMFGCTGGGGVGGTSTDETPTVPEQYRFPPPLSTPPHLCPYLVHKITNVPFYMGLVLSGFQEGKSILGGGPKNWDFFGPWNGNERSECHSIWAATYK